MCLTHLAKPWSIHATRLPLRMPPSVNTILHLASSKATPAIHVRLLCHINLWSKCSITNFFTTLPLLCYVATCEWWNHRLAWIYLYHDGTPCATLAATLAYLPCKCLPRSTWIYNNRCLNQTRCLFVCTFKWKKAFFTSKFKMLDVW